MLNGRVSLSLYLVSAAAAPNVCWSAAAPAASETVRLSAGHLTARTSYSPAIVSPEASSSSSLWSVDTVSGALRQLTDCAPDGCADVQQDWSPDGRLIAFRRLTAHGEYLYSIRPDGSQLTDLVHRQRQTRNGRPTDTSSPSTASSASTSPRRTARRASCLPKGTTEKGRRFLPGLPTARNLPSSAHRAGRRHPPILSPSGTGPRYGRSTRTEPARRGLRASAAASGCGRRRSGRRTARRSRSPQTRPAEPSSSTPTEADCIASAAQPRWRWTGRRADENSVTGQGSGSSRTARALRAQLAALLAATVAIAVIGGAAAAPRRNVTDVRAGPGLSYVRGSSIWVKAGGHTTLLLHGNPPNSYSDPAWSRDGRGRAAGGQPRARPGRRDGRSGRPLNQEAEAASFVLVERVRRLARHTPIAAERRLAADERP